MWIAITIAVFLAGIGIGYVALQGTASGPMNFASMSPQQMQHMMNEPNSRQHVMNQLLENQESRHQMMEYMTENPDHLREWVTSSGHAQEMTQIMRENHDFTMEILSVMMNDEQMQLQMMGHMTENAKMMEHMGQMMGSGDMMNQGMMDNNMMMDMMKDPETREKMIDLMIEHTEQFQEIRSQDLDDEQLNQQMMELMKQHMEKMQNLMKDNHMHQMMNP